MSQPVEPDRCPTCGQPKPPRKPEKQEPGKKREDAEPRKPGTVQDGMRYG